MTGHRIVVVGEVDFPDGSRRVMYQCRRGDCAEGHVEASPGLVADVLVGWLVDRHQGDLVGEWLGGGVPAGVGL